MKNLIKLFAIALVLSSCTTTSTTEAKERMIGFHPNPEIQDLKWHLGTQEAIDHVIAVDKLWAAKDYESMRSHFVDTVKVTDWNGKLSSSFNEFKASMEADDSDVSWTFDYAYSVDIDPSRGGEHVQAGFSISSPKKDGSVEKYYIHESYYIINQKIVTLSQYKQASAPLKE